MNNKEFFLNKIKDLQNEVTKLSKELEIINYMNPKNVSRIERLLKTQHLCFLENYLQVLNIQYDILFNSEEDEEKEWDEKYQSLQEIISDKEFMKKLNDMFVEDERKKKNNEL